MAMDQPRISSLLTEASDRYNAGDYQGALALWREVEQLDPANEKAQEGIRMAALLLEAEAGPNADPRVEAVLSRVRDLLASGDLEAAREGCTLLERLAPGHPELAPLMARCGTPAVDDTQPAGVEQLLEAAREALADGREEDAARAAARALEMEPGNMEACGILSLTGQTGTVGTPPPDLPDTPAEELELDTKRQPAVAAQAPPPSPAPSPKISPPQGEAQRISALLAEGQVAFDQGRAQEAISTWSRIFVIDHSHAEASRRIDMAKAAIEEQAREVDDLYFRAVDAQEAGRLEEAILLYKQVLQVNPDHFEAKASVDDLTARLAAGEPAAAETSGRGEERSIGLNEKVRHEVVQAAKTPEPVHEQPTESVPLAFEPRGVRDRVPVAPSVRAHTPPASGGRGIGRTLALAGGVLVFAAAGAGAWLWLGSDTGSMPEARATVATPRPPGARPHPGAAASTAPAGGAPAQAAPGQPPATDPAPSPAAAPGSPADAAEVLARARELHKQQKWAEAVLAYREAMRLNPADFDAQDDLDKAMAALEKQARLEKDLEQATRLFEEQDFAGSLHTLYRLQQDRPDMKMVDTYIRNAWYNWGVMLIQAGDVDEAAEKFGEVLELDPRDATANRAREVARRYHGRQRDSVLESYAATLKPRPLDAR
jgi:tetratricopeptide (TPR) repeat protein